MLTSNWNSIVSHRVSIFNRIRESLEYNDWRSFHTAFCIISEANSL